MGLGLAHEDSPSATGPHRWRIALWVAASIVGCSNSSFDGSGTVNGSVGGVHFTAASVLATSAINRTGCSDAGCTGTSQYVDVTFGSVAGLGCGDIVGSIERVPGAVIRRNYTSLQISIANDGALLTPGTYDVFGLTSTMLGRGASSGTEGPDVNCSANFGYLAGTGSSPR